MREERRRDPRVAVGLSIRVAYGSMEEFIERQALNVSNGGVFIRTRDLPPVGTTVTIDIRLQGGAKIISGRGIIARTTPPSAPGEPRREPGIGVQFTELDAESRATIAQVVAARAASAATAQTPTPAPIPPPAPTAGTRPSPPRPAQTATPAPTSTPTPTAAPIAAPIAAPAPTPTATAKPTATSPAPARKPAGRVVGIDLGTTNSCVAISADGKASILTSPQGHQTIPSVVAFDAHGRLLVGHAAKRQMIVNPRNTVYGSKRLIGRPFASPTVQACRDRFHYDIVEGPDGAAAVRFAGRDFTLQQITAFVLGELRSLASNALGAEVSRAIVTVPAYYNDHQRNAVRAAGALAGLSIERIVNEPTAAALAYAYGRRLRQRVLVYDLGGGTFDASVLEIDGDVYEVVSTGGDTFLGGVDFDARLVDHLVSGFRERQRVPLPDDGVVWQRIRDAAEEAKVALSARESTVVHVPFLCEGPGGEALALKLEVTRAELEALTAHLVERTLDVCKEVLAARGLGPSSVDEVLLVGGQSRMPLVWRRIREVFGKEPSHAAHPDEAVALGAALLAESETRIDSVVLIDVLAMGIGVGLAGGRMKTLLPRNVRLPATSSYEVATTADGQTQVEVAVFQGESEKASECEYLGTVRVAGLTPAPRGAAKVAMEFSLGAEGILAVAARDLASGTVTRTQLATLDTAESLRQKLQISEPPTAPRGARPIDAAPPRTGSAHESPADKKGLLGRLFGRR